MQEEKKPLFTVIIPVKDRAEYLYHTLRTCMNQNYENLEIIVSDDGSTDNTKNVVEEAIRLDSRIRYISRGTGIGMRDNFELTLQEVKPGYVIALGGDDGLLPGGIKGMWEILSSTGMEMLAWAAPLYSYPKTNGPKGQLAIYYKQKSKIVNSKEFLKRQAKHLNYLGDLESPMFYVKGVVSTKLIDKVRNRTTDGRFYACPTPDGFSGIVLAGEVEKYAFSAKPFSIYGLSPASQGLGYLSNKDKAKKSSEDFFKKVEQKPMHKELASQPYSPLITLMTVDYLLTARDLKGWPGVVPNIEYSKVLDNSITELSHGLYGLERISREIKILNNIADLHGMGKGFRRKIEKTKRCKAKKPFNGNGLNAKMILIDAEKLNIENIYDAAYCVNNLYGVLEIISPTSIFKAVINSLIYKIRTLGRGENFPSMSEWNRGEN